MGRARLFAAIVVGMLVSAGFVASTGGAAHAQFWSSNFLYCSGPYTSGAGTSRTHGGGSGWPNDVYHYRVNPSGPDVLKGTWLNTSTSWAYRTSHNHGAGNQAFSVIADYIDSVNSRLWCEYIG
jgi:hypothetical protein